MHLFQTRQGLVLRKNDGSIRTVDVDVDAIFTAESPLEFIRERVGPVADPGSLSELRAPIGRQEVWAAGVTYVRSRTARMAESDRAGGSSFYDRVYEAERPEIFFKSTASRVADPGGLVRIRSDCRWCVPEPELALAVSSAGRLFGYTIGNDVSARDIEGENPLYLPQAKVYAGSCSIGPSILLNDEALPGETEIVMRISRAGEGVFSGTKTLSSMKRTAEELIEFLFRDNVFPAGCLLLTGTGIVPPDDFTLEPGDEVAITIEPIGTLENGVAGGA